MSCDQLEQIARQRTAEMHCEAAAARAAADRGPRVPVRHRAGRALVTIGHRLTAG
jgi:hypothetical protein